MARSKQPSTHPQQAVERPSSASPLAQLVGDVDRFSVSQWGQQATRTKGHPHLLELLDIDSVDSLLTSGLRRPHFRVIRDGATLPAADSTRRVRTGGILVDDFADPDRIADLLAGGATLVLQGLEHIRPHVADFAAELTTELGHRVQANAYLSPPHSAGLAAHTDTHDVFAVQLHGRKLWTVDGLEDSATSLGDVLYIPAGVRHAARTSDSWSLHLTVGVHAINVGAALRRAVERVVASEPLMRRPLPVAFGGPGRGRVATLLRDARADLIALLSEVDIDSIVDAETAGAHRVIASHTNREAVGSVAALVASMELTVDTTFIGSAAASVRSVGHTSIEVIGGRRTLTMPARARGAVEHLLSGRPCTLGDVPDLDDASRLVLVRRLMAERIVVQATQPTAGRAGMGARHGAKE